MGQKFLRKYFLFFKKGEKQSTFSYYIKKDPIKNESKLNIQKENRYGVESTEVDFGKLSNLKEITFSIKYMEGTKFCNFINHLPPFVNIHTNPVLKIYAQEIKNLTDKDYEYAKQYSQIKPNYPYPGWPFN